MERELIGPHDWFDLGGTTKKEGSVTVRLLAWVTGWTVRPFAEEKTTKWVQVRGSRVTLWPLPYEMSINHPHGDVELLYGTRENAGRRTN